MSSSPSIKRRKKVSRTQTLVEASQSAAFDLIELLRSEREETKEFCDLTIRHGDEEFVLHKCLFGTMSEYFDKLFSKVTVGDHTLTLDSSEQFANIKKFVENIYNGEIISDDDSDFAEMYAQEITDEVNRDSKEEYIREQLNSDRLGLRKYCDVTISTGLRKFPVHKSILAVHSEYFSKMFAVEMKEKYDATCHVTGISDDIMALVLDFIYTKQMWVKDDQFLDLLATSDYLCMKEFQSVIVKWGVGLVTAENCIQMWITGHQFEADLLIRHAGDKICQILSFTKSCGSYLVDKLHFERLIDLLMDRISKDQVLIYAITWVKQDINGRKEMFEEFFDQIKPESLTQSGWTCLLNAEQLIINNPMAASAAISYMKNFVPNTETEFTLGTMYVLCSEKYSEFKIFKCDMSSLKPAQMTVDEETVFVPNWSCLTEGKIYFYEPAMSVCNATLHVVDRGTVRSYVKGRWDQEISEGGIPNSAAVACYDDTFYVAGENFKRYRKGSHPNQWFSLAFMANERCDFVLVPYKGFLFAIGGKKGYGCNRVEPIEVYSIRENSWSTLPETCPELTNIKMKIVHDEKVYIVYGSGQLRVATFDLEQRRWIRGKSAETALVARCAGFTLSLSGFKTCVMDFTKTVKA